ncbi:hypothetical protein NP493_39g01018 [Ridgeia piscesae]|uniref:Uncharacterized protein n=1 Tax=Ridgeia piscesae TaxID=27915 RepID=A0AAD9PCB7_RIDPI|nr:hypothetical protein NP493_39g01018 [Ridgeia piscesae]
MAAPCVEKPKAPSSLMANHKRSMSSHHRHGRTSKSSSHSSKSRKHKKKKRRRHYRRTMTRKTTARTFAKNPSCSQLALSSSVAWNEDGAGKESVVCSRVTRNHPTQDQQIFVQREKTFLGPHLEAAM